MKTSKTSLKKSVQSHSENHAKLLKESEEKYRKLLDSANDAIFIADTKTGIVIDANKQATKLIGLPLKKIIGMHQSYLHSTEEEGKKMFKNAIKVEKEITPPVFAKHSSGKLIPIEISSSVYEYGGRKLIQGIFRDITDRQKFGELKRAFVSSVVHELKTPLTTLKLLTQAMAKDFPKDEGHIVSLRRFRLVESELERLNRLINDLYDISRIETGKLAFSPGKIKLNKIIDQVVEKIKLIYPEHKIVFRNSEEVLIFADPQRLEQVATNILTNAVKFSPKNKNINISISKKAGFVIVKIRDYGIGIPKKKLPFIFDRFYQTGAPGGVGLGLGLYIAKEIITQHKGKIWAESQLRKGTTFYFSLPVKSTLR